ncbi:MAG: IS3 family transposase [Anaerolineae bacterium]
MSELASKIGVSRACEALNVPRSRVYRAHQPKAEAQPRPMPAHALSDSERAAVRDVLNSERFMDRPPRQVYAALLDEGTYLCHWRTMYRILHQHNEVCERRRLRRHPVYQKPELLATAPNQVWSWDITYLRGEATWIHYPLYTVLDIFSRYVVGWMIAEVESSELAKQRIAETARKQGIQPDQLTLHADNGSPMKGKPLSQLLVDLGITRSHSRPHTSDDNPFSEAHFKTMKYHPDYPDRFGSSDQARQWARAFFGWYNDEFYHSGLNLLTPASVHYGEAEWVRQQRHAVMLAAYAAHPARFVGGIPQVKEVPNAVWINPPSTLANPS